MNHRQILQHQPWLRLIDINRISSRLLEYSHGDLFVAYNVIQGQYELHSVKSFLLSGYSYNASFEKPFVNGFIFTEFRTKNHRQHGQELESERARREQLYDIWEEKRFDKEENMKKLHKAMGVKL